MKNIGCRLYCPERRRIVDVHECYRQGKAFSRINPNLDIITICCSTCNKPIMKVTKLHESVNEGVEK